MSTIQYAADIITELNRTVQAISPEQADRLVDTILSAKKIFVTGAGRSGLMTRAFAMRMMHLGLQAYVVGESVTPGIDGDDLLIIGSGSGQTKSLGLMAEKARGLGATVALVTIVPDSTIGRIADPVVVIPAKPKEDAGRGPTSIQPMGSLFEQSLLLFYDAIILEIMEKKGVDPNAMFGQHANLE
jgi:6-phospho-3-hexuloisomerase